MTIPDYEKLSPKDLTLRTIAALQAQVREMEAEEERERKVKPPEPTRHNKWTVSVRYAGSTEVYEYLIIRAPKGRYYTTGIGTEKQFRSWEALVAWLHGPRVAWHGLMRPLIASGDPVALPAWGIR